jgi:hypothetical protein
LAKNSPEQNKSLVYFLPFETIGKSTASSALELTEDN